MKYFFDSYIIIEIINLKENYLKFKSESIITNSLNLAEVYYFLLRNYDEKTAEYLFSNLNLNFIEITPEIAIEASKFKYLNKKEKLSYADCIGYISALKHNILFLTGDMKFENKKNVEFIK